jgi:hypothetical protein
VSGLLRWEGLSKWISEEDCKEFLDKIAELVGLGVQWLFSDVVSLSQG